VQRISNCDKVENTVLYQTKYWTFWNMDYSARRR